jgi:hypothetical protein
MLLLLGGNPFVAEYIKKRDDAWFSRKKHRDEISFRPDRSELPPQLGIDLSDLSWYPIRHGYDMPYLGTLVQTVLQANF